MHCTGLEKLEPQESAFARAESPATEAAPSRVWRSPRRRLERTFPRACYLGSPLWAFLGFAQKPLPADGGSNPTLVEPGAAAGARRTDLEDRVRRRVRRVRRVRHGRLRGRSGAPDSLVHLESRQARRRGREQRAKRRGPCLAHRRRRADAHDDGPGRAGGPEEGSEGAQIQRSGGADFFLRYDTPRRSWRSCIVSGNIWHSKDNAYWEVGKRLP